MARWVIPRGGRIHCSTSRSPESWIRITVCSPSTGSATGGAGTPLVERLPPATDRACSGGSPSGWPTHHHVPAASTATSATATLMNPVIAMRWRRTAVRSTDSRSRCHAEHLGGRRDRRRPGRAQVAELGDHRVGVDLGDRGLGDRGLGDRSLVGSGAGLAHPLLDPVHPRGVRDRRTRRLHVAHGLGHRPLDPEVGGHVLERVLLVRLLPPVGLAGMRWGCGYRELDACFRLIGQTSASAGRRRAGRRRRPGSGTRPATRRTDRRR